MGRSPVEQPLMVVEASGTEGGQACSPASWCSKNERVSCGPSGHCPARWTVKEIKPLGVTRIVWSHQSKKMAQGRRIQTADVTAPFVWGPLFKRHSRWFMNSQDNWRCRQLNAQTFAAFSLTCSSNSWSQRWKRERKEWHVSPCLLQGFHRGAFRGMELGEGGMFCWYAAIPFQTADMSKSES